MVLYLLHHSTITSNMSNTKHTPEQKWTPEPWKKEEGPMYLHGKYWSLLSPEDYERARACVNAMAGIEDPATYIATK